MKCIVMKFSQNYFVMYKTALTNRDIKQILNADSEFKIEIDVMAFHPGTQSIHIGKNNGIKIGRAQCI